MALLRWCQSLNLGQVVGAFLQQTARPESIGIEMSLSFSVKKTVDEHQSQKIIGPTQFYYINKHLDSGLINLPVIVPSLKSIFLSLFEGSLGTLWKMGFLVPLYFSLIILNRKNKLWKLFHSNRRKLEKHYNT